MLLATVSPVNHQGWACIVCESHNSHNTWLDVDSFICGNFLGKRCPPASDVLPKETYQSSLASVTLSLHWGLGLSDLAEEQEVHCVCVCVRVACWVGTSANSKCNQPTRKPSGQLGNHFTICRVGLLTVTPTLNWGQLHHYALCRIVPLKQNASNVDNAQYYNYFNLLLWT